MKQMRNQIILFLILFTALAGYSQVGIPGLDPNQLMQQNATKIAAAKAKLAQRGLSEEDLTKKLKEKGYDLQNLRPEQLPELEGVVDDAILELEAEKKAADAKAADKLREKARADSEREEKALFKEERDQKSSQIEKSDDFDFKRDPSKTVDEVFDLRQTDIQEEAAITSDSARSANDFGVAIYGQQVFKHANPKLFTDVTDIIPANDYLVGPGDIIRIVIFGRSIYDGSLEVDEQGNIDPQAMPKIYVKGLPWADVKKIITSRYKQRYAFNNDQIAISLQRSRTITVSVFGEVNNPGSFTYPAANTAFNLISLARGLTDIGSVRNIKIVTPGGRTRTYDVYQSMMNPEKATNIYLQTNDFVQVPVADRVVNIIGAIIRPHNYELLPNETLLDLIKYAGGFTADADQNMIQVLRYENGARKLYDLTNANAGQFKLMNGDQVTIIKSSEEVKNMVRISGEVERPGDFQWEDGLLVSDLLQKAILRRTTKMDIGFLQRLNNDNSYSLLSFNLNEILMNKNHAENYKLLPNDRVLILALPDYTQYYKVNVSGAVRNPGVFDYDPARNMRVVNLITLAGGTTPDMLDNAYLIRTDTATGERSYVIFDLKEALNNPNSSDNIEIQPLDRIVVISNAIINHETFVTIGGAVQNPGKFKYGASMTLLDAITLAGGMRLEAANNRVEVFRVVMQNNVPTKIVAATYEVPRDLTAATGSMVKIPLEPYDMIEVRSVPDFDLQRKVQVLGEVLYPGTYALLEKGETIYSVIQRAGGLNPAAFTEGAVLYRNVDDIGNIIIELDEIMKDVKSPFNIVMREQDILEIPRNKEIVSVFGAVNTQDVTYQQNLGSNNRINVAFINGKSAKYYIKEYAGGFADNADKKKVYVENSNGRKSKVKSFLFFKKYPEVIPGASVYVAYKEAKEKDTTPREKADWTKVLAESVAQATAILTLVVLINTINRN